MLSHKLGLRLEEFGELLVIAAFQRLYTKTHQVSQKGKLKTDMIIRFLIELFWFQTETTVPGTYLHGLLLKDHVIFIEIN